jgi:hypothetical protein
MLWRAGWLCVRAQGNPSAPLLQQMANRFGTEHQQDAPGKLFHELAAEVPGVALLLAVPDAELHRGELLGKRIRTHDEKPIDRYRLGTDRHKPPRERSSTTPWIGSAWTKPSEMETGTGFWC